jgi:hypothetical protein
MNQSPRTKPTLINGVDTIFKPVEDRRTKVEADGGGPRSASHEVGPVDLAQC